ncbi:MAG: type I glutamate--ammonia ligase [Planctomycetota bacterium]
MSPQDVLQLMREREVAFLDCRFMDFPGLWQHTTYTASDVNEDTLTHGFGFDGSSIRGWQRINESDMLLVPDCSTAVMDPFTQRPTLIVICDIKDPITKKRYSRDPRSIARKAQDYLKGTGIADTAYFGPEMEFFVFDRVRYDQRVNTAFYEVDSPEGLWNRGSDSPVNRGNQIRLREGYFPCPPTDTGHDLRGEMVTTMEQMGLRVECHHHEVATGGQGEIDLRYDTLLNMSDKCMIYKYVVKRTAAQHGQVATFMPKPLFRDNGSGMHVHFSLWNGDEPLFGGRKYAGLSQEALWAIGGILRHAPALTAFCNPTTNSFKRLVPGYEAPTRLVYSSRNRSAAIRIPQYQQNPATKRIEFRCPDPAANPYLAFSAILMAALDGIDKRIDPGDPVDVDLFDLNAEQQDAITQVPGDLDTALDVLERDHDFLLAGDVFTEDVIRYWVRYKREQETDALRVRPHPYEFCMYFDV